MLGLKLATDPRWANAAEMSLEEILTDHAYCEQKAASSAISLIVKFSQETQLVADLTDLVAEEWGHFRRVMKELSKRGLKLGLHRKDRYVAEIKKLIRDEGSWQQSLCEKLLLFALIEARSCERFRVLSLHVADEDLRKFYHEFMVSEAGHYVLFMDYAKQYMPEAYVKQRWEEILAGEAAILATMEPRNDRVH